MVVIRYFSDLDQYTLKIFVLAYCMNAFITVHWQLSHLKKQLDRKLHNVRLRNRPGCHPCVLAAGLIFISALLASPSLQADSMSLARVADPVIITGQELGPVLGSEIGKIRLFAFDGVKKRVIPFQIDERDSAGNWVWDRVIGRPDTTFENDPGQTSTPMMVQQHVHSRDDEDPAGSELFDANDMLIFLARDMGDRHTNLSEELHGGTVLEIEVLDPLDGARGWAYLVSFAGDPPPLSGVRYLRHFRNQRRIQTPSYDFTYSDTHVAVLDDLRIKGFPVVDRINIRGKVDVRLGFLKDAIEFGEEDIHGYIEGIIEGPVRVIKRNVVHLDIGFVVRTPDTVCEHFYYPDYAKVPLCLPIRFPVTKASVLLLAKLNESTILRTLIGEMDGSVTRHGNIMDNCSPVHQLPIEWIAFDTAQGSVLSILELPDSIAAHADARPCLCDGSDSNVEVEMSMGLGPVAGFAVTSSKGCPAGPHVLHGTYLISTSPYQQGDENAAYNLSREQLTFKVRRHGKDN
jgi:hypothetical protein